MKLQHRNQTPGSWAKLSLQQQLANVGMDTFRAISWRERGNEEYATSAFYRAIELLDLTLSQPYSFAALRELARLREVLIDYFIGANSYASSKKSWQSYFGAFIYAASIARQQDKNPVAS